MCVRAENKKAAKRKSERERVEEKSERKRNLTKPPRRPHEAFNRLVLELVPRLHDLRVHLLHSIAKFDTEAAEDIALPGVILGIDTRLNLLVVDYAYAESLLRLRRIERRARFLDLRE